MTKIDKMVAELMIARAKVAETRLIMMDANTSSIFWNKMDTIHADIEASIKSAIRFNWSDAVTDGLNADTAGVLTETGACLCAIYVIQFDMSRFVTRTSAENMVNILRDIALRNLSILRDKKSQEFMKNA